MNRTRTLVTVGLLIALEIVLSRFCSIQTPIMKIGFAFVALAICGMMFGPLWGGICGAIADFVGVTLFPTAAFFPGFTLSTALTGVIFGLFLYNKDKSWMNVAIAVALNCLCISLLLNTYWLTMITGTPYAVLLPTRIIQVLIMIPIQFIVIKTIQKPITVFAKKQFA